MFYQLKQTFPSLGRRSSSQMFASRPSRLWLLVRLLVSTSADVWDLLPTAAAAVAPLVPGRSLTLQHEFRGAGAEPVLARQC